MRDFKKRRHQQGDVVRFSLRALGVFALLIVTSIAVRAAWGMYGKLARATTAQNEAQAELQTLRAQADQVGASVAALSSGRGVEAQMRQRFGVARPGEGEITIVQSQGATSTAIAAPVPWWRRIFQALFVW